MSLCPWADCEKLLALASSNVAEGSPLELTSAMELWTQLVDKNQVAEKQLNLIPSLRTGLGEPLDSCIFSGGLHVGEICEIFGPPDVGKTQFGLAIAASHALSGRLVMYIDAKDLPFNIAARLHTMIAASGCSVEHAQAALGRVRIVHVSDLTTFARALEINKDYELLIVDGLSGLLAPYVLTTSVGRHELRHRWRLVWACRALRSVATHSGVAILLLSHSVQRHASVQLPLGQLWADAIGLRLEMSFLQVAERDESDYDCQERHVSLSVRKSMRTQIGQCVILTINNAGVVCDGVGMDDPSKVPVDAC